MTEYYYDYEDRIAALERERLQDKAHIVELEDDLEQANEPVFTAYTADGRELYCSDSRGTAVAKARNYHRNAPAIYTAAYENGRMIWNSVQHGGYRIVR